MLEGVSTLQGGFHHDSQPRHRFLLSGKLLEERRPEGHLKSGVNRFGLTGLGIRPTHAGRTRGFASVLSGRPRIPPEDLAVPSDGFPNGIPAFSAARIPASTGSLKWDVVIRLR